MGFQFRSVRRALVAKTMLLLWLFGVVVGSANACVLQERLAGAPWHDGGDSTWLYHVADGADLVGHVGASHVHADRSDRAIAKQACKSLCDDAAGAVVKTKPVEIDPAAAFVAVAFAVEISRPLAPVAVVSRFTAIAPPAEAPVPILFLRLTI